MKATARPPDNAEKTRRNASRKAFVRKPIDPRSRSQLVEELDRALQGTLSFLVEADDITERRLVFAAYIDGVKELNLRGQDVARLIQVMRTTAVDFEVAPELVPEAQQAVNRLLQRDFAFAIDAPLNIASADLAALPVDELRERFRAALKLACKNLATQLVTGFSRLVERKVVGLVYWPSQNAVSYDFYRRRLYCKDHQLSTSSSVVPGGGADRDATDPWQWKEVITHIESSNLVCVLEHHHHEAVDAFQTTVENSKVVMPTGVQILLQSIPTWMKPSIRIVDGYLIGETVQLTETCEEKLLRTTVTEEPIYGLEPAVVLGPFVLAGWGPREIDAASRASKLQALAEEDSTQRVFWGCCALGTQILTTMFLVGSAASGFLLILAMLVFLASVTCLARALRAYLRSIGRAASELTFQSVLIGPVLCAASWQAFFLPFGTSAILIGFILGTFGALLVFTQRHFLFPTIRRERHSP